MPSINLRLTEEQHAALKKWAREDSRSIQHEIIFRLFSPYVVHAETPKERADLAYPLTAADAQPRDITTRTIVPAPRAIDKARTGEPPEQPQRLEPAKPQQPVPSAEAHFKPDPKGGRK